MDFQSAMETFAEAWVAANTKGSFSDIGTQSQALALTRGCKTPPSMSATNGSSGIQGTGSGVHCDSPTERLHSSPPPTSHHDTPHHDSESIVSPPPSRTLKEGFDLSKTASGKSLPVHCVVEAICTLEEPFAHQQSHAAWRRRPVIETDSYVIIPVNTIFHELVQVALQRLGYSSDSASAARGSVVIKNWKPLSFDKIADGPLVTVGDILGELTTVATLRIQVYRARPSALNDIKDKLLRLLLIQSHGLLLSTGCPLDEIILSQICRGNGVSHRIPEPSEEARRKFDQWWSAQVAPPGHGVHAHPPGRPQSAMQYSPGAGGTCIPSPQKALERSPSLSALAEHVHPALQTVQNQYPTQKTRMRTSFDPELELPKLQNWFAENQHPSRQQIQQYVKELNSLESRRGRKPLDVNNVVYWFKNARAAQKRAETRGIGPCHLGVNGYTSSSHSPPNGTGLLLTPESYLHQDRLNDHHLKSPMPTNVGHNAHNMSTISEDISNAGSDLEEDDPMEEHRSDEEQPQSPNVPLSLTTTRKNDDRDNMHQSPQHSSPPDMIKEEPKDDPAPVRSPPMSSNNNNNHKDGGISDIEEDDLDDTDRNEDPDERKKSRTDDEPLYRMDLRPPLRNFRSPTPEIDGALIPRGPGSGNLDRIATAGFPLVPNSMFSHSIMYMSHYIPGLSHAGHTNMASTSPPGSSGLSMSALAASTADERRKRNRTFIDPVTEVPRLEHWFSLSTHPSHNLILKYTEELNRMPYRQKFPRLEPKNVQFWFKNRRAKCKRLKMALFDNPPSAGHAQYHHSDRD